MDNIASVRKPIGLSDAVQAIEEMCNNRAAYAHGGVRVQPIMLELGAGNGQTVFLRYVTDMLKAHKIRHFGGLDHYLEFVTDGTLEQLKEMFADIRSAAVYTNFYEGVVAIDITALGRVITEKQMRYFLSEILKVAQYATIIFYISPEAARNRKEVDQLVEKVMSAFNYKIQLIEVKPYTHAEFAEMVAYNIRQKRVAAYCRVSTDSEEQLTSYTNQMKVYTEMIASNKEWEFAGLYADEGISGTRADKRPQFQKMIEDCHKGKIDMIITKSVSRFARNTVDCLDYVRSLKEIGVGIYFEEQNIDTLKSDSELYLVIYAGFAQSESESISKNITWTHRKNFEDGKPIFMYSRMLGYRKGEDGNPEIVPEEAAIVQRVFDMYLSGKSTDEISEILQAEKIVIPGKKLTFSKSMIIRMLKNEKYCGDAILQKTVTIDPISKKRKANEGEAPMWLVENSHPAIVTREIFNKAQEESARRKAKAPVSQKSAMTASGKYSKYALTEVMICGECGSRYKRVTWNIRGKRRIVWRCISRLDYGKKYCTESITVDEQALQRAIVRALNRFNVEDEATYLLLMKSTIGEAVGINGSSDEIDLLERRIDALNKRMLDLVSLSVQEGDDAENHEDDFKNISTQIEQLTKRITAIRESESENGDFQARLKEIQDIIDKRRENKDIYDDSIVRQMVECIKVYHDGRLQIILGGGYELEEYLEK